MSAQSFGAIGRVKTAMVLGAEGQARGAVCTVLARVRDDQYPARIQVGGQVKFEPSLVEHTEQRVLPLVDAIGEALLPVYRPVRVELSVINIGAASVHDVGIGIGGFSADAPIFLAVLSAMLAMPVRQYVMVSGHLSSDQGDIGAVRGLPEKLAAATSDSSIRACLIPSTVADTSLETLLPAERERVRQAMIRTRRELHLVEIRDVEELIRHAIDDESVVLGSLQSGFFATPTRGLESTTPIARAIQLLAEDLDSRFYAAIERSLFPLNINFFHELLTARAKYAVGQARYPQGLGAKLRRFMLSLPPAMRRKAQLFPLLPKALSLAVCGLAQPEQYEDVQDFLAVCSGKGMRTSAAPPSLPEPAGAASNAAVASVLSELSSQSLATTITAPIDRARAHYCLENIAVESDADFWEIVTAFYVTLLRHTGSPGASADSPIVIAESHGLLERAFADQGGATAAKQEGRDPASRGGMRFVLDVLTNQFKSERQHEYIRRVVAESFDPLDWPATVRFMSCLLDHIRPVLSPEALPDSPAQLVPRCSEILLAYVRSRDRMTQLVRSL